MIHDAPDWKTIWFVGLAFVGVLNASLFARHVAFANVSRETWSVCCRSILFLWFLSLWMRIEAACGVEGTRDYVLRVLPLPKIDLLTPYYGADGCFPHDVVAFSLAQVIYYIVEWAYMAGVPAHMKKPRDETVMLAHHIITIAVIAGALLALHYYWCIVFISTIHDISDVFLDGAKSLRARAKMSLAVGAKSLLETISTALFYLFVLSWFVIRVYYIPFVMIPAIWATRHFGDYWIAHFFVFFVFLLLQIPQAIWTGIIVRVVYRNLRGQELADERDE